MITLPTTCVRCGATGNLTTLETLAWLEIHGPGKCEKTAAKS